MDVQLRWIASSHASGYHAAAALLNGQRVVDARLKEALAGPSARLGEALQSAAIDPSEFLRHLVPLSAGIHVCRELAQVALTKTVGRTRGEEVFERLLAPMAELESVAAAASPGLTDQLALRAEPLRMQWEARGAGLLREIVRMTDPQVLVQEADVILVHPVRGGGGCAHVAYNSVRIEAVLADTVEELPEVLRLGWLLSMLNLDLPDLGERLGLRRLRQIAPLAMLPAVLTAAETVELGKFDPAKLALALRHWQGDFPDSGAIFQQLVTAGTLLSDWWQTHLDGGSEFSVALVALAQLLP